MFLEGLFIDGFAGGGGASTGIAQAIGREVDIAVNHSETAIAIHKANHPGTEHFCQDIRAVWPRAATRLRPVAGAWFSPDCKEYSKAKGGPVKDRHIRALSDEVEVWLREVEPRVAYLENVEEYETAGPLDEEGREIKEMRGKPFKRRVARWRRLGYSVRWWKLRACDYGAPTIRRRLYIVMRRDGLPIVKPKPTHGPADHPKVKAGKLLPYRTAAECIDWSLRCPSIFDRKRPLAEATMRRIAAGVMRFVVNAERPYIVGETIAPFVSYGQQGGLNRPVDAPHHVVAASPKDTNGLVAALLHKMAQNGVGKTPRAPLDTAMAGAAKHGIITAHIEQANTGMVGHTPRKPFSTIVGKGCTQRIVETLLVEEGALPPALLARATAVAAFLVKYYATDGESEAAQVQNVDRPLDTITTKARFAVVTVTIDATTYVIVDIGLRMLTPRELARAQGFPDSYVLDPECWYTTDPSKKFPNGQRKFGRLPISYQISAIGNSVCPPVARALVAANQPGANDNIPLGVPGRLAA